ncbi:MAG TPA: hypothetical protein VMJ74_07375, partial [Pseudomonadales bacterium]|nr:hypothetical protein [Pseudomonadales bacterium]
FATQGQFYRFENEDGVTVIASSIPPNLVYKGYSIVREDGTVVKKVAPQLTPAEVEKRDRELAEQKKREQDGEAQRHHDEDLVKLYASPRDVEEARDRKLLSIQAAIAQNTSNIQQLKLKKERFETEAAARERDGQPPSPDILDNLKILDTQIADKERDVAARQQELQRTKDQFQLDLDRVKLLYSTGPSSGSSPTPSVGTSTATPTMNTSASAAQVP